MSAIRDENAPLRVRGQPKPKTSTLGAGLRKPGTTVARTPLGKTPTSSSSSTKRPLGSSGSENQPPSTRPKPKTPGDKLKTPATLDTGKSNDKTASTGGDKFKTPRRALSAVTPAPAYSASQFVTPAPRQPQSQSQHRSTDTGDMFKTPRPRAPPLGTKSSAQTRTQTRTPGTASTSMSTGSSSSSRTARGPPPPRGTVRRPTPKRAISVRADESIEYAAPTALDRAYEMSMQPSRKAAALEAAMFAHDADLPVPTLDEDEFALDLPPMTDLGDDFTFDL